MTERIDEFGLQDIPGVGHVSDFLNRRKGKHEAVNLSRMLMKQYMTFLGRHKGMKATVGSLRTFIDNNLHDGDRYVKVIDRIAPTLIPNQAQAKPQAAPAAKPAAPKPARPFSGSPGGIGGAAGSPMPPGSPPSPAPATATPPTSSGRQTPPAPSTQPLQAANGITATGQPKQATPPVSTSPQAAPVAGKNSRGQPRQQPQAPSRDSIDQARNTLSADLMKPADFKQDMESLHTLLADANAKGGETKQKVMDYLSTLRSNKMLQQNNPKLSAALNGKNESAIRLIDFASFLVEYDLSGDAFKGALQFLYEAPDFVTNSQGQTQSAAQLNASAMVPPNAQQGMPGSHYYNNTSQGAAQTGAFVPPNVIANQNADSTDYFMNYKLPRSSVLKILNKIAVDMIDSGDYSYDAKDVHGQSQGLFSNGSHEKKNTKPRNHDGISPPSHGDISKNFGRIIKNYEFKREYPNPIPSDQISAIEKAIRSGKTTPGKIVKFAREIGRPLGTEAIAALYQAVQHV